MPGILARLNDALLILGRAVELSDVDPGHFKDRLINLAEWLPQMNARYAATYQSIELNILNKDGVDATIYASDYLLELIFWNIWLNAHEMIGERCVITIEVCRAAGVLELLVLDNGAGFPKGLGDIIFSQAYSSNSFERGRGLLEVAEAVARLHGTARIVQTSGDGYRIKLVFRDVMP
jgi:K+-sensing histidine kinase KdpD